MPAKEKKTATACDGASVGPSFTLSGGTNRSERTLDLVFHVLFAVRQSKSTGEDVAIVSPAFPGMRS